MFSAVFTGNFFGPRMTRAIIRGVWWRTAMQESGLQWAAWRLAARDPSLEATDTTEQDVSTCECQNLCALCRTILLYSTVERILYYSICIQYVYLLFPAKLWVYTRANDFCSKCTLWKQFCRLYIHFPFFPTVTKHHKFLHFVGCSLLIILCFSLSLLLYSYAPDQPYNVTELQLSQCRPCDQLWVTF